MNLVVVTMIALFIGLQMTLALTAILSFMNPTQSLANVVYAEWMYLLKPEWETVIYRFFIATTMGIWAVLLWRRKECVFKQGHLFLAIEGILTIVLLIAGFKMINQPNHCELARIVFVVILFLCLVHKVVWSRAHVWLTMFWEICLDPAYSSVINRVFYCVAPVLIVLVIHVPYPQALIAEMFMQGQTLANDLNIMGPGWAFVNGSHLNIDVICRSSVGAVMLLSNLAKVLGGFTYVHVLEAMIISTIIYYLFWYFVLKHFWRSGILALAAVLIIIKSQMFYEGALPVEIATTCFNFSVGASIFMFDFWHNMNNELGVQPIYSNLVDRQFWRFFVGLLIPIVYVITALVSGFLLFTHRKNTKSVWLILLCIYGLIIYQYYIIKSQSINYALVSLPFIIIVFSGIHAVLSLYRLSIQRACKILLLFLALGMLASSSSFTAYPNVVNMSKNPLINSKPSSTMNNFKSDDQLVQYYNQAFDLSLDAQLIAERIAPWEGVPVICDFEVPVLMKAKRKPYFYYFPLYHETKAQIQKTLDQIIQDQPTYIFIEQGLLLTPLPNNLMNQYRAKLPIIEYVRAHYEKEKQGQYLIALRRVQQKPDREGL